MLEERNSYNFAPLAVPSSERFPAQGLIKLTPDFLSKLQKKKKITAKGRKFARLMGVHWEFQVPGSAGEGGASSHPGSSKLLILQGRLKLTSCQLSAFAPKAAVG